MLSTVLIPVPTPDVQPTTLPTNCWTRPHPDPLERNHDPLERNHDPLDAGATGPHRSVGVCIINRCQPGWACSCWSRPCSWPRFSAPGRSGNPGRHGSSVPSRTAGCRRAGWSSTSAPGAGGARPPDGIPAAGSAADHHVPVRRRSGDHLQLPDPCARDAAAGRLVEVFHDPVDPTRACIAPESLGNVTPPLGSGREVVIGNIWFLAVVVRRSSPWSCSTPDGARGRGQPVAATTLRTWRRPAAAQSVCRVGRAPRRPGPASSAAAAIRAARGRAAGSSRQSSISRR